MTNGVNHVSIMPFAPWDGINKEEAKIQSKETESRYIFQTYFIQTEESGFRKISSSHAAPTFLIYLLTEWGLLKLQVFKHLGTHLFNFFCPDADSDTSTRWDDFHVG